MLSKMKVLSFCHFIQGPVASQYLGDLGADVIKVESPSGAWERAVGSGGIRVDGRSVSYLAGNRNKRSLVVDLKHPQAREVLYPVIASCDVVMENFRLGVLDRLGFGYDALRKLKPDLIYASATGWGSSGPLRDKPGVDIVVQARTGLIAAGGRQGDFLPMPGAPVVDHHGGALLAMGVMAAYIRKLATGKGTRVETSLLAAGLDVQAEALALYASGGKTAADLQRDGRLGAWYAEPPYGVYKLADCHAAIGGAGSIDGFTRLIGAPALLALGDGAHQRERDVYVRLLGDALRAWTFDRLAQTLAGSLYWFERVADYDDVLADPQIEEQQRFARFPVGSGTATVLKHPVRYDGEAPGVRRPPPELGEHTRDILAEAGLSQADIDVLVASGAVRERAEPARA